MTATLEAPPQAKFKTFQDVLDVVGDVAPERILLTPAPGTATEQDLLDLLHHDDKACELIDGILVEKPVGFAESVIAATLIYLLHGFVRSKKLGVISGEHGPFRLQLELVRIPDIAFVSWSRLGEVSQLGQIGNVIPELTIEVLSPSNRPGEMTKKRREYFKAGVLLHWIVDPKTRTVAVFTSPEKADSVLHLPDTVDGGSVLPGFQITVQQIFEDVQEIEFRLSALDTPNNPPTTYTEQLEWPLSLTKR